MSLTFGCLMRKVLFVIPDAGYSGAARQLALLATTLPRAAFAVRVVTLGGEGPLAGFLREAGIAVDVLGWTRLVDFAWLRGLRDRVHDFRPDVIHAVRLPALRAACLVRPRPVRLIASDLRTASERAPRLGRIDRWLLRRVNHVVARSDAEAAHYRALGVPAERIVVIPPAVLLSEPARASAPVPMLAPGDRVIVGLGPLERPKGFRDAVWAMGILRYLSADPHLVLVGSGAERSQLEEFARATDVARRVHFVGEQEDVRPFLERADLVWVPSRAAAGRSAALEAMAAGRPVVASRRADLAELIVDGETGLLVPPGDKVALARQTRLLLDSAALRQRLGEAGRRRAAERFTPAAHLGRWQSLYEDSNQELSSFRARALRSVG